ncbi:hypothetical protein BDV25DRAFT_140089 [Aspergillus avenaceus]|uniref:Hydrophobin n=1 Tax=Aspergillus avenaceus TaxID=36643 RepID=A0A5N6TUX8_ASPAV|nr:hypothetical protein BDV25DRAFT_140089 [Aspergillus avenaceus]
MNFLTTLLLTATLTSAIPFNQATTPTTPTPTTTTDPVLSSLISAQAAKSTDLTTCPLSKPAKQCCQSFNSIAKGVTDGVGDLVPIVKDVEIKSLLSFECRAMKDTEPNENCLQDIMCCAGKPGSNAKGGDLFKECLDYEKALQTKKEELERSKKRPLEQAVSIASVRSSIMAASSSAVAASSPSKGVGASPTN